MTPLIEIVREKLPYRKSVVAIVLDRNGLVLLVQKNHYNDNQWDFPGGGVEGKESQKEALKRELFEEQGIKEYSIISKSRLIDQFEWPDKVIKKMSLLGKKFRGQRRTQFLIRFNGEKDSLKTQRSEIKRMIWVKVKEIRRYLVFPGQWESTKKLLNEFGL